MSNNKALNTSVDWSSAIFNRNAVNIDYDSLKKLINGKKILVTGGGGSIGSELCRQISKLNPNLLIIFDIYENNVYEIDLELKEKIPSLNFVSIIGSIRDEKKLKWLFSTYKPDIVFHAAAHKHVPLMEFNAIEAVKNNIFGTFNLIECSKKYDVNKFILISTDKAVNPSSVMGMSKRFCEMLIESNQNNNYTGTDFLAVRFGNVLESNGSVIPLFKKQIEHGGPLTVTGRNVTRYFMTISEAVSLILVAATNGKNGNLFILDMGEQVSIYELAKKMIAIYKMHTGKNIDIKIIGMRPGEKVHEELLLKKEKFVTTKNDKIFVVDTQDLNYDSINLIMNNLKKLIEDESVGNEEIKKFLSDNINRLVDLEQIDGGSTYEIKKDDISNLVQSVEKSNFRAIEKEAKFVSKKILLASPHMSDNGYEINFVRKAFADNWIAPMGENVDMFEVELEQYLSAKNVICLNSGTSAIHLGLKALGVKSGDIVFCSDLTFAASANPIIYEGAIPVFIDCDKETYNISPEALQMAVKKYKNAKVLIVTHLYGAPVDFEKIKKICDENNILILEDAAEALGSSIIINNYRRYVGTLGDVAAISFNGNKIITTSGGGAVVTNNDYYAKKIKFWATQSKEPVPYYEHKEIGYNYRMSNICAGIGRGQLKVLDERIEAKIKIFERYKKIFENYDTEFVMQKFTKDVKSNCWLSVMQLPSKVDTIKLVEMMEKKNIEVRAVWKPMHLQPIFKDLDYVCVGKNGNSGNLFKHGICLPSDTKMTEVEQNYVIDELKKCIKYLG